MKRYFSLIRSPLIPFISISVAKSNNRERVTLFLRGNGILSSAAGRIAATQLSDSALRICAEFPFHYVILIVATTPRRTFE